MVLQGNCPGLRRQFLSPPTWSRLVPCVVPRAPHAAALLECLPCVLPPCPPQQGLLRQSEPPPAAGLRCPVRSPPWRQSHLQYSAPAFSAGRFPAAAWQTAPATRLP